MIRERVELWILSITLPFWPNSAPICLVCMSQGQWSTWVCLTAEHAHVPAGEQCLLCALHAVQLARLPKVPGVHFKPQRLSVGAR